MKNDVCTQDRIVVITGATSGIGFNTALKLAGSGMTVIGTGRSQPRCDEAKNAILKVYPEARLHFITADLSSMKQVRELAENIRNYLRILGKDHLDTLVNNAGTFSSWYVSTAEGFELQFAVNHLAPFLLTHELLPELGASQAGKVIMVSSGSHYGARIHWKDVLMRRHYNCLSAYKQSKLANVLFAAEFNRRFGSGSSVRAFAIDPGLVNTDIGCKGTTGIAHWIWMKRRRKGTGAEVPAACIAYLCLNAQVQSSPDVYWKDCRPKAPSRYSRRPDVAVRFWELSEKLCGIKYDTISL